MKKIKSTLIALSLLGTTSVYAQQSSNIKVTAKAQAGCKISSNDIHFTINDIYIKTSFPKEDVNLNLQCTKNTAVTVSVSSLHNPSGSAGSYLAHTSFPNEKIQYQISTRATPLSTDDYVITRKPSQDWLTNLSSLYSLALTTKNGNPFVVKLTAQILNDYSNKDNNALYSENMNNAKLFLPGDYRDSLTYSVTF